jgi:hypothetical protein
MRGFWSGVIRTNPIIRTKGIGPENNKPGNFSMLLKFTQAGILLEFVEREYLKRVTSGKGVHYVLGKKSYKC